MKLSVKQDDWRWSKWPYFMYGSAGLELTQHLQRAEVQKIMIVIEIVMY